MIQLKISQNIHNFLEEYIQLFQFFLYNTCNKTSMNFIEYLTPNKKVKKNPLWILFYFIPLHNDTERGQHHVLHSIMFHKDTSSLFHPLHFPLQ